MEQMLIEALIWLGIAFTAVRAEFPVSSCQDLDTQACLLFHAAKVNICTDPAFSGDTCRRFCGTCPLECYSCPEAISDPSDCNVTKVCGPKMRCIRKELIAEDGHHEFILSCERHEICDGLAFGFGKRDIDDVTELDPDEKHRFQRDVIVRCCNTDFCNYHGSNWTEPTTTAVPATRVPGVCYKDIVFVMDDSGSVGDTNFKRSLEFVREIISKLRVGPTEAQVAVMAYSSYPQIEWYLNKYNSNTDVIAALNKIQYLAGATFTGAALKAVRSEILTPVHGDRLHAENTVVVLSDGNSNDKIATLHEANDLHKVSTDVISVVVGQGIDRNQLNAIATDYHHVIDIHSYRNLTQIIPQVVDLICA